MKKILILTIIAFFCVLLPTPPVFAENETVVKVVYSTANAYSDSNHNSQIVATYVYGQRLNLSQDNPIIGSDGLNYYIIKIEENSFAYILCSHVQNIEQLSPSRVLECNATLNKQTITYTLVGNELVATASTLTEGTAVKLLDAYNQNEEYSLIQYKNEYGEIVTAYIHTHCLNVSNISTGTITAVLIIITTISLVLIIFGVKKRKKRKII